MSKFNILTLVFSSIFFVSTAQNTSDQYKLFYDTSEPAIAFAAEDLKNILESKNISVTLNAISQFDADAKGSRIIIAKNDTEILAELKKAKATPINQMNEQEYSLRVTEGDAGKTYWAIGGDRVGASGN